uniref:Uncharacterized protein n=1 Tax=Lepeophtheirus salmonis TaxID=72036 RepID=A0A0K2VHR6_LEPSM
MVIGHQRHTSGLNNLR